MIKISPSVLASDLSRLADEVNDIQKKGADMAHLDVMDGVFVTNISFGLSVLEALRKNTDIFFDVHLMITKPERYIERFITEAGADLVTFHLEATEDANLCIDLIKKHGKRVGISIKPKTEAEEVFEYLDKVDMVLVMTVEPGYGGQAFMPEMLDKIKAIRTEIERRGLNVDIQVDGGINPKTAKDVINYGANIIVAGSSVFKAEDRKKAIDELRG